MRVPVAILLAVVIFASGAIGVSNVWAQGTEKSKAEPTDLGEPTEQTEPESPSDSTREGKSTEADATAPAAASELTRTDMLIASLTIFLLAIFVGFEVITKVPPTLHTPLMSGSNAISGITIVGALIVAGHSLGFASFLGFVALILATINVVGGFMVTHRMLAMFKKR
jgi:NAD(P) transhydrogenase subunit alpha